MLGRTSSWRDIRNPLDAVDCAARVCGAVHMLMVIFGAGASYDSSPDKPPGPEAPHSTRPPLADKLFVGHQPYRQFRDKFPQFLDVVGQLLPRNNWSVEDALQRLVQDAKKNQSRRQQLTAIRFYLQSLLDYLTSQWLNETGGATNYGGLIDQIENHRTDPDPICFVTFNYDTLLESALSSRYGSEFGVTADYVSPKQFKLFKLHGSTDWAHTLDAVPPGVSTSADMIAHAANISPSANIITLASYAGGAPLYPAIAIPVVKKSVFECPQEHIQELKALLPKVTKILAIGWRGTEDHFLELLHHGAASTGISVVTIAGTEKEAEDTLGRLRSVSFPVTYTAEYAGFSSVLAARTLDEFLAG